jgi:molecular chaperone DnaJ
LARRDYYTVLGVGRDASSAEVKQAFRELALRYHPDRRPEDLDAEKRFREIVEAYETLSDPENRARYQRLGPLYRPDGQPPTPEELNEFVARTVGSWLRRGQPDKGEDLRFTLAISLEAVSDGAEREIEVPRQVCCRRCEGQGADTDTGRRMCADCEGTGRAKQRRIFRSACPRCDGRGWIAVKACAQCGGDGHHGTAERLKVRIPAGVASGQKLKLRQKGNESKNGGDSGDLYVLVSVEPHPLFQRRGKDLLVDVPITFAHAALGAEIAVPTLRGGTTIRLPAGTESGKTFRLAGQGLPDATGGRKGHLHLRVVVEVPPTLDKRARALLSEFAAIADEQAHPQRAAFLEALKASNKPQGDSV